MKISRRESVLAVATIAAALYAGLLYFGSSRLSLLEATREEVFQLQSSIAVSRALVAEQALWEERMAERQSLMPVFPQGQRMDVHWLTVIEGIASRHQLQILRHEPGEERREGPVYELPIFARQWEGTLDALVHFLFDLEQEGAMLDVRYLHVRPKDRILRHGRFDIYCAYRRES